MSSFQVGAFLGPAGDISTTGWPRSVSVTVSPPLTRATMRRWFFFSSCSVTVFTCRTCHNYRATKRHFCESRGPQRPFVFHFTPPDSDGGTDRSRGVLLLGWDQNQQ